MIVAIDGPAASGKGTLGRGLAKHFGFAFLDTGLLYRATALHLVESGGTPEDIAAAIGAAERVHGGELGDPQLRSETIGRLASAVAVLPGVRLALLAFQRNFAANPPYGAPGAVLDGRDIGTVVCPDAEAKIFITATVEERARRRFKELRDGGSEAIYERVLQDLRARDKRDSERRTAPLRPADDAFVLDTSNLDADAAFEQARDYIVAKRDAKPMTVSPRR
jgi:cytidylate kinase